jgi:hypothetical protein
MLYFDLPAAHSNNKSGQFLDLALVENRGNLGTAVSV